MEKHACHAAENDTGGFPRPGRRLVVTAAVFAATWLLASQIPALAPLARSLSAYVGLTWWAVLLGFVVGGLIDYFVPDGFVVRFLGQRRKRTLLYAVLAGLMMSACSHGMLAVAIELHRKGASAAAVVSFLLASPWANLPMTVLLFGFFGGYALLIVAAAMLVAYCTGLVFLGLDRLGWIEGAQGTADASDVEWSRLRHVEWGPAIAGVAAGSVRLANMVLWWILIGILIAASVSAWVPQHWFMDYLGPDATGMSLTLLFATVLEVCSEGTSPVAFEIFDRVGVLGNPFLFLMAGVATDYTEIGLLWSNIGRRTALWLPAVAVPQILFLAWLMNALPLK